MIRPLPTREIVRPLVAIPMLKPIAIPVAGLDVLIEALAGVTQSTGDHQRHHRRVC